MSVIKYVVEVPRDGIRVKVTEGRSAYDAAYCYITQELMEGGEGCWEGLVKVTDQDLKVSWFKFQGNCEPIKVNLQLEELEGSQYPQPTEQVKGGK